MESAWRSDASGASGSEAALQTSDGSSSSDEPVGGDAVSRTARRKRGAECLAGGGCLTADVVGVKAEPSEPHQQSDAFGQLTLPQKRIINRVVAMLDSKRDSVVFTNPLQPNGPIVYVTNAWQDMCGYTAQQAVGENPRLMQGEGTDPETVRSMRLALSNQQPCRVRIINYRGYNREPFWNCLSVRTRYSAPAPAVPQSISEGGHPGDRAWVPTGARPFSARDAPPPLLAARRRHLATSLGRSKTHACAYARRCNPYSTIASSSCLPHVCKTTRIACSSWCLCRRSSFARRGICTRCAWVCRTYRQRRVWGNRALST